jgi:ankyrin repeat protein
MKNFKFVFYLFIVIAFSSVSAAEESWRLFRAAKLDSAPAVRSAVKSGESPNVVNADGESPLLVALKNESYAAAEALADLAGADVDRANPVGETPLMMAALKGRLDLCRKLIALGAKVNRSGWTPLHYAASGEEIAVVELMLDSGAEIDSRSPNRTTPLMMAAGYGNSDMVPLLLKRGANAALRNDRQLTAHDFALNAGREKLAKQIAEATGKLER